ncbi:MAG: HAD family hydrolase [Tissierella sp.]|uniref:HAD family hydrolase n=1 Tax=Tissierella sp. TaxID=41274 RepID=UPI003F95CCF8
MKNIKMIILDFDGTVVSSMGYMDDMLRDLLLQYDIVPNDDMLSKIKPKGFVGGAAFIKDEYKLHASKEKIFNHMRKELSSIYTDKLELKAHVIDFVKAIRDNGIKICLATANQRDFVLAATDRTGLDKYLDYTVTINELNTNKQSPKIFLHCAQKFNLTPEECIVFEDSAHSCQVAKDAGFYIAGVSDESNKGKEEKEIRNISNIFVEDFSKALQFFT